MKKNIIKQGKFLSLILRHDPGKTGLTLDHEGWADVEELINKFNIDRNTLEEIVQTNNKKRYSFNKTKTKIRANQGHSIKVDLGLKPVKPPHKLYHGTATRYVSLIQQNGLIKQSRQHVHLSTNLDTAKNVGQRHQRHQNGKKVPVFIVDAQTMQKDGYKFYLSDNGVWLTDHVPPKYLTITYNY